MSEARDQLEEHSKDLKEKYDDQVVTINESTQKAAIKADDIKVKTKLLITQKGKLEESHRLIEDLTIAR